jgi:DNA-binding protein YbaB
MEVDIDGDVICTVTLNTDDLGNLMVELNEIDVDDEDFPVLHDLLTALKDAQEKIEALEE